MPHDIGMISIIDMRFGYASLVKYGTLYGLLNGMNMCMMCSQREACNYDVRKTQTITCLGIIIFHAAVGCARRWLVP